MDIKTNGKKRYPLFFLDPSHAWRNTLLFTLLLLGAGLAIFFLYARVSTDLAPDSLAGYGFALAGTLFMVLAAVRYTLFRRSRGRRVGMLNASLHWHISFGIVALVFLCLHSFGNFNPRSGTYALYGMIALVISGVIGRLLDRMMPRLIAKEASKALTEQGEDRIERLAQTAQAIVTHNTQQLRSFSPQPTRQSYAGAPVQARAGANNRGNSLLPDSWDLAYISLEETPQEVERDTQQYRFVPDRKSVLSTPAGLMPGLQEHVEELQKLQQTLKREEFYRAVIRYWRVFHISLVVVTIALTLWHLEFAASLLIPVFMHH